MAIAPAPIVTLTTDFGTADWFVGTIKGVIARLAPQTPVIDLTHQVPPGDIRAGAFALLASYSYFPPGTIHLVVVDPGVGSSRKSLAVQTQNYFFLGPDNGVLSWALAREKIRAIHALENQKHFLRPISQTFHGRDVFAPVAAHLSLGLPLQELGPKQNRIERLTWPRPRTTAGGVLGQIVYIDHFGNAISNIEAAHFRLGRQRRLRVFIGPNPLCQVRPFYGAVSKGQPLAVLGSSGFLEIAINGGSAARALGLCVGTPIRLRAVTGDRWAPRTELGLVSTRRRA
jgi:S-adenosyl-L-methionine hydrolase (adenosine-forming)